MAHKKQIIFIFFLSFILGLARFALLDDSSFSLIKKERIIQEITSFKIPENITEPMSISLEFSKHLFDSKAATFIDARDVEDYRSGHIKNAINIPFDYYEDYEDIINSLDERLVYILYCNGTECSLSLDLADYLFNDLLFEKVLIFEGGWPEWRDAQYPENE